MKLSIIISCLTWMVVSAQYPYCDGPDYFESKIHEYNFEKGSRLNAKFFYDATRERIRVQERENPTNDPKDILILHRQNKMYIVDIKSRKCTITKPIHPFHRIETDDGFHYLEDVVIGSLPDDGVTIGIWYKQEDTTEVQGKHVIEFTRRECIPIYYSFNGTVNKERIDYSRSFFDVIMVSTDPNIFHVPDDCLMNGQH